jgi:hypothetical protein
LYNKAVIKNIKYSNDLSSADSDCIQRINDLIDSMSLLEQKITNETEIIKEHYRKASSAMKQTQNYFLNGIQDGQPAKSYLLTCKGIEVLGEEVISIDMFIDNVLRFANYPKRKIEVMKDLAMHLQKISQMISESMTT